MASFSFTISLLVREADYNGSFLQGIDCVATVRQHLSEYGWRRSRGAALMTRCCRSVVLQQVGSYLGYTGRVANPFGKASCDPTRTWPSLRSRRSIEGALISFVGRVPSIRAAGRR